MAEIWKYLVPQLTKNAKQLRGRKVEKKGRKDTDLEERLEKAFELFVWYLRGSETYTEYAFCSHTIYLISLVYEGAIIIITNVLRREPFSDSWPAFEV